LHPILKTYRVQQGRKFHKSLLDHYGFIFNDPKDAYEFYDYINIVFELNHQSVDRDVPFDISDQQFYFSFYEAERSTNFVNLVPIVVDAKLEQEGIGPLLESSYTSRNGQWYIIMTVFDEGGNDALHPKHAMQKPVKAYLNTLRKNYLKHENYYEILLNKNPD
jgi:hypothetical protein